MMIIFLPNKVVLFAAWKSNIFQTVFVKIIVHLHLTLLHHQIRFITISSKYRGFISWGSTFKGSVTGLHGKKCFLFGLISFFEKLRTGNCILTRKLPMLPKRNLCNWMLDLFWHRLRKKGLLLCKLFISSAET